RKAVLPGTALRHARRLACAAASRETRASAVAKPHFTSPFAIAPETLPHRLTSFPYAGLGLTFRHSGSRVVRCRGLRAGAGACSAGLVLCLGVLLPGCGGCPEWW